MDKPIINPTTLSEEQREAIKEIFKEANTLGKSGKHLSILAAGQILTLGEIFGVEFFIN